MHVTIPLNVAKPKNFLSLHSSFLPLKSPPFYHYQSSTMKISGFFFHLLLLLFAALINGGNFEQLGGQESFANDSSMEPLVGSEFEKIVLNDTRRRLNSFQICSLCTCCGGLKRLCMPSPCCYAINCNIPNRPFGFCSFTPKTCNCFGCHL